MAFPEEVNKQAAGTSAPQPPGSSSATPPPESTKPIQLKDKDFIPALEKVEEVREHVLKFGGKTEMNPYVWIDDNITPLTTRYDSGERSPELFKAMMKLEKVEPTIDPKKYKTLPPL